VVALDSVIAESGKLQKTEKQRAVRARTARHLMIPAMPEE